MYEQALFRKVSLLILLVAATSITNAQSPTVSPTPAMKTDDEVVRIDTNLIQTGFSVVDKNGAFVKGLKKEDLELKIDGKPVSILFMNQVSTPVLTSKKSAATADAATETGTYVAPRTMVFVVDDMHLIAATLIQTRKMVIKFIDEQMLATDRVAIVSTGGKIGFLQQFTSDKAVLRAAADRLTYSSSMSSDDKRPPAMDEFAAQSVERGDRTVTDYFVGLTAAVERLPRMMAESLVQARARAILARTRVITASTLDALESTIRQSAVFPGRKAIFFISDGFLLDPGNTDASKRLNAISDIATRSNSVIYSFDAKGLDATLPEDGSGMGYQMLSGSRFEKQDGLSYVAYNTGGKFIHNTNAILESVTEAASEAFTYYLVAWEPETESVVNEKLRRIDLTIKGRPELKARTQQGYLATAGQPTKKTAEKPASRPSNNSSEAEKILSARSNNLATALAVRYLDLPEQGPTASATVQIGTDSLEISELNGNRIANVEISGAIFDADGKQVKDFKLPVEIKMPDTGPTIGLSFNYDYNIDLKPGLYQLRVTTRDVKGGRTGSAAQWVNVPDLSSRRLALSSLMLGERKNDSRSKKADEIPLDRKVENRFERTSSMRYMGFIYNASGGKADLEPDLSIQTQIIRSGKLVGTVAANLVEIEPKDNSRIPFAGELFMDGFAPGVYELKLTVTDKRTKRSVVQLTRFEVV